MFDVMGGVTCDVRWWCIVSYSVSSHSPVTGRPPLLPASAVGEHSAGAERMYQRTRYRDLRDPRDLRDLRDPCDLSSELSDETSSLFTGSTASTRERLLQGRWRQGSLDGSQDTGSISTISTSTLRYSEPDTCRSFSSTSSVLSPARRYPRCRPHTNINRTRSFQSVRPPSPVRQEDLTFQEYKSLSAQDFRKGILREERLALDTDDDRLSSTLDSQDLDRGSLRSARFSPTVIMRKEGEIFYINIICRLPSPVSLHLITILLL